MNFNMNSCLTYFCIFLDESVGFDLREFCDELGLDYEKTADFGTDESIFIGYNQVFKFDMNDMLRETLAELFGKEDALVRMREKFKLRYYLMRVPTLKDGDDYQRISLDDDIIEFMYKTGTHDQVDYFLD